MQMEEERRCRVPSRGIERGSPRKDGKKKENSTWPCEDGYYADDGDDAASLCLC